MLRQNQATCWTIPVDGDAKVILEDAHIAELVFGGEQVLHGGELGNGGCDWDDVVDLEDEKTVCVSFSEDTRISIQ